jgi:AcrR family transcriptional regulator
MKEARSLDELEQVRMRILDAALSIIIKEGFDALTMRKLASRIGMTAPNIYNYFSSKDELYISIVIRGFEMLHNNLKAAYQSYEDPLSRALSLTNAYMNFGIENSAHYEIMFSRATPKYNDYVGTPYEKLSAMEYRISMEIAQLAMKAVSELMGGDVSPEEDGVVQNVIRVWSTLHGMVSLFNSQIIGYVARDAKSVYEKIIDNLVKSIVIT